jgi:hypothetical protein
MRAAALSWLLFELPAQAACLPAGVVGRQGTDQVSSDNAFFHYGRGMARLLGIWQMKKKH